MASDLLRRRLAMRILLYGVERPNYFNNAEDEVLVSSIVSLAAMPPIRAPAQKLCRAGAEERAGGAVDPRAEYHPKQVPDRRSCTFAWQQSSRRERPATVHRFRMRRKLAGRAHRIISARDSQASYPYSESTQTTGWQFWPLIPEQMPPWPF